MTSLLIHAALGALTVGIFFYANAYLYRAAWPGSRVTFVEGLYYALAVASVCMGWYFNVRYVFAYPADASWPHFIRVDLLHDELVHELRLRDGPLPRRPGAPGALARAARRWVWRSDQVV